MAEARRETYAAWFSRMEQLFGRLLELARAKQRVLLTGPPGRERAESLEAVLREEEALLAEARRLAEECPAFSRHPAGAGGAPGGAAAGSEQLPEEAEACCRRLGALLAELYHLNRENGVLVEKLRRYVDFSLGLLARLEGQGGYGVEGLPRQGEASSRLPRRVSRRV